MPLEPLSLPLPRLCFEGKKDSVACEGRSLLKSFVTAAARREESIHVLSFDLPESEFKAGLSTDVTSRISFHDAFPDPLGWSGRGSGLTVGEFSASELASRLATTSQGSATLVLDSLSWLLLRFPFPSVCQVLAQLPRRANVVGLKIVRIVALVHGDLHPPAQLDVLKTLARLVVTLQPGPGCGRGGDGTPRTAVVLHRKRGSRLLQKNSSASSRGLGSNSSASPHQKAFPERTRRRKDGVPPRLIRRPA
ncbi:elongator complex protein 5 isoform X3 [Thamnophis elegans]|uniref:elongator complex protein 5 isoform X3 n=1 Tax=Thamnophis elegans TaxID=35005 RepID=UPI001376D63F|nr:elongator complex protein 5 isoform X3 [Thamnophis elegans]